MSSFVGGADGITLWMWRRAVTSAPGWRYSCLLGNR